MPTSKWSSTAWQRRERIFESGETAQCSAPVGARRHRWRAAHQVGLFAVVVVLLVGICAVEVNRGTRLGLRLGLVDNVGLGLCQGRDKKEGKGEQGGADDGVNAALTAGGAARGDGGNSQQCGGGCPCSH